MKKEIEFKVDPVTGKKSLRMNFDLAGLMDFVSNISNNIHVEWHSYYDWWEERAKPLHKYWNGYEEFLQADASNRPGVMAEAAKLMESWFSNGVTFSPPSLIGAITYEHGPPEALREALRVAQGKILGNILEWSHISEYLRPQILMWVSAQGYGKGEIKASFEWKTFDYPPVHIVRRTDGMNHRKRAYYVANEWYDFICHRLYGFVNEIYAKESKNWKQPQSLRAVEKYLDAEQRLKDLGLDLPDRLEYYARWLGYQCTEVSEMLRTIGVDKSTDAVKKSYQRNKKLMATNYGKS